jgi:hypothetical protein
MPQIEVTVAAPVDTVWEALRDKEKVRQWHGWDYHGLDDEIDQVFFGDVVEDGRTLALGGGDRFALSPSGTGTAITLIRPPLGAHPEADAYYDEVTEGWTTFLQQLRFALDRQPGAVRRTLYFAGENHDVAAELGIADVARRYTADFAGEPVSGELWFRSAEQVGVTVDGWGEGLLVVAGAGKPSVMAVLSTYGLDEAAFADLDTRWTTWWSSRFAG